MRSHGRSHRAKRLALRPVCSVPFWFWRRTGPGSVFTAWHRLSTEPIISPRGSAWESAGTFNPAVVFHRGKFVMLYRAQDHAGTSRLGYAESIDGIHFDRRPDPVLSPETDYEKDGGVEDPRLVKIGDTYYLTYTGYNKKDAQLCLATSKDLIHWQRKGVIVPAYQRQVECGLDQVGRDHSAENQRKVLDVLAGNELPTRRIRWAWLILPICSIGPKRRTPRSFPAARGCSTHAWSSPARRR